MYSSMRIPQKARNWDAKSESLRRHPAAPRVHHLGAERQRYTRSGIIARKAHRTSVTKHAGGMATL